jgi:hypothetical protein
MYVVSGTGMSVRTVRLEIRLTEQEKRWLEQAAWRAHLSLSEYVRTQVLAIAEPEHSVRVEPQSRVKEIETPNLKLAGQHPPDPAGEGQVGGGGAALSPSGRPAACPMLVPKGIRCKVCGKVHQA